MSLFFLLSLFPSCSCVSRQSSKVDRTLSPISISFSGSLALPHLSHPIVSDIPHLFFFSQAALRAAGAPGGTVNLRSGSYWLAQGEGTVQLGPEDGGSAEEPVTYQLYPSDTQPAVRLGDTCSRQMPDKTTE